MNKRRVVVTGATGYIFSRMLDAFSERYDLVLLDVTKRRADGREIPGVQIADLTGRSRDAYRQHFRGADAVLHCAFIGGTSGSFIAGQTADARSQKFQNEMLNVQRAYNVYQAAVEENVRRVVVCSSNHAADYYERLIWADRWDFVDPAMKTYSD